LSIPQFTSISPILRLFRRQTLRIPYAIARKKRTGASALAIDTLTDGPKVELGFVIFHDINNDNTFSKVVGEFPFSEPANAVNCAQAWSTNANDEIKALMERVCYPQDDAMRAALNHIRRASSS